MLGSRVHSTEQWIFDLPKRLSRRSPGALQHVKLQASFHIHRTQFKIIKRRQTELREHQRTIVSKVPYRELIGALMYLAVATRPDIAHAVSWLSRFNECYNETHWLAAKRILRYLRGTSKFGISYIQSKRPLIEYVDADWANCIEDRRSYTGFAFILASGAITWESRKQ